MIVWEVVYSNYDDYSSYGLFGTEELALKKLQKITGKKLVYNAIDDDYSAYCGEHLIGWGTKEEAEILLDQYELTEHFSVLERKVQTEE